MSRKQLFLLFISNVVPFTIGGSIMPLLPVYLARLGIDPAVSGIYLAVAFLALAGGSFLGGWLSDRFQRRRETIFMGALLGLPMIFMIGQVSHIAPLTILTVLVWFLGGMNVAMVNILAGLFAEPHERGRVFGIIGMGLSIGGVIGGTLSGAIVDRWGFGALFAFAASLELILMSVVWLLEDKRVEVTQESQQAGRLPFMTMTLWLLFVANILANAANISTGLSRPLGMDGMGFSATAISSTNAVAGFVTIPLSLILGWASDRLGRKPVLLMAYSSLMLGGVILVLASSLWQFWIATALMTVVATSLGVGTALVTDVTAPESLATAVSRYAATPFIGGAIGFGGSGLFIANFDIHTTFIAAVVVAGIAFFLLTLIGPRKRVKMKPVT